VPKLRKGFWFYFPVALLAWFAPVTSVKADALGDWTFSQSCATGSVEVIDNNIVLHGPDGGGCGGANWVKIETTIPADVNTVDFTWAYQTNDGWVYDPPQYGINGVYTLLTQQNNATGTKSVPVNEGDIFTFRQYSIDSCCQPGHLTISNLSLWNGLVEPTTTSSTTTTTTSSTTTSTSSSVPQTTSTVSSTTTTLPLETSTSTTEPQTTTTSSTSTTVPETSTTLVENTTSTTTTTSSTTTSVPEVIVEVPTGTTTTVVEEPYIEEMPVEETTTTTEPEPETTEPETTTTETYPDTTVEETTTTTTLEEIIPEDTVVDNVITEEEVDAVVEELTTITEITPEILSEVVDALNSDNITEEQVQAIVDAVVENLDTLEEITPEVLEEVLGILESDSITQEQVQEVVDTILATEISSDQATELATSAAVLENVTANQATEIFATVDTGELTSEQAQAIVDAVQDAPTEVKEAFEEEINVFEGGFDNYVPTDSTISVGVRRVVVAATTVSFILPAPVVSSRRR